MYPFCAYNYCFNGTVWSIPQKIENLMSIHKDRIKIKKLLGPDFPTPYLDLILKDVNICKKNYEQTRKKTS